MKNALIVASVASMIDQFNMSNIKLLKELGYQVDVACNFIEGNTCSVERIKELKDKLKKEKVGYFQIDFARDVLRLKQNTKAYQQLKIIAKKKEYKLVHCHAPIGGVLGRIIFRKYRKQGTKVLYTAHGFHFYKGAPLKNWLFYYPVEKFLSRWTDCLITINKEDYKRAKKKFNVKKIEYVPGVGVDTKKFNSGLIDVEAKRKSLGILDDNIMLLSVGKLSEQKNHEVVIRALKKLKNPKIRYFVVDQEEQKEHLSTLIKDYGLENQITLLGYRTDISELCQAADLFIFPSKQESLPVALMEAIACKTSVICSKIRGNIELVQNKRSMFDACSVDDVVSCLEKTIGNKNRKELAKARKNENMVNYKRLISCDLEHVDIDMNKPYHNIEGYNGLINLLKKQNLAKELKIKAKDIFILSVGELNRNKNHSTVIRAIAKLKNPSIHYIIVGQGELKEELRNMAEELGVAGQVHLLGFREDIADIMRAVDIYCLPSLREGLNVSLMEAMASGLPCAVSKIRGNVDLIDEKNGVLFDPKSVESIKEALLKLQRKDIVNIISHHILKIRYFCNESIIKNMTEIYKLKIL